MRRRYLGIGVLGLSLVAFIGCGGTAPKANSGAKTTPTSSSDSASEDKSPSAAGSNTSDSQNAAAPSANGGSSGSAGPGDPVGVGSGSSGSRNTGSGQASGWTGPGDPVGVGSGATGPGDPVGVGSGATGPGDPVGVGSGASGPGDPVGVGSGATGPGDPVGVGSGATGPGDPVGVGSGATGPGNSGTGQSSSGPGDPVGAGSDGPPPASSGNSQGNSSGGTGSGASSISEDGAATSSGSQSGSNSLPPGYGGQSGPPPQQGGPPAGFNNLPPGYGGQSGPPPQQNGPPAGMNKLPPGYGGQSGPPPQQGGPPAGFNNLPPGYGGQSGPPPQQSGPPAGMNKLPPGYGGQSGPPPQQSGPPAGINNLPPGYGGQSGPPQQNTPPRRSSGGAGGESISEDGNSVAPGFNPGNQGAFGQPATAQPEKVEAKSFWDMASNAYAEGRDADAYKYLMAEFAANRNRFDEIPLSFSTPKKNTTIGVRLGIGVSYSAREGVSGKPPVIGDPAPSINRGNQRGSRGSFPDSEISSGGPGSGMPGGNSSVPRDARGMLVYYGGDLATELLDELEQRFKRDPAYGLLWPRVSAKVMLKEVAPTKAPNQGGGGPIDGPTAMGGNPYGPGGQQSGPAEGLFPGLTFLGEGNPTEMVRKAKNEGLDGFILIEHSASVVRSTGATTSQTTVKYYSCSDGKEKASTAQLGYATVAAQVADGKAPVGKELKNLFTKIDRLIAVAEMPELTAEQAKGRLESIVAASKNDPLPFVNEVNYYLQKGWLIEDDAQEFIIQALGEPASLAIWSGDFEKQKSALGRWLPTE